MIIGDAILILVWRLETIMVVEKKHLTSQIDIIFIRLGLAGAVLHTASSLIHSLMDPFPPDLHNIINPKQLELVSLNFERMFTQHHVSSHLSHVTCHLSHVTFLFLIIYLKKKN